MMSDRIGCLLKEKCPTLLMGSVNLESSNLLANLVAKGVITQTEKKFIKAQGPDFKQVETLVDILLTKCDEDVYKFIDALEDSELYGVARELRSLCKEEASHTTGGATGGRQEKTVSVKAEVTAEFSSFPTSEDETETRRADNKPSITSGTGGDREERNCEPISPSRSEQDENSGDDTSRPHLSAASDISTSRKRSDLRRKRKRLEDFEKSIANIIKTKARGMKRGRLDIDDTLDFLADLTSGANEVIEACQGSILVIVRCRSLAGLYDLKEALESDRLRESFIRTFFTHELMTQFDIMSAGVHLSLNEMEYIQCEKELKAEGMQTKMDKLDIEGDVERRLDEPAQEEESRHHSPASKHAGSQRLEKSKVKDTGRLQKLRNCLRKSADSGLGATKASRDPEYGELRKGVDRDLFMIGEACKPVEVGSKLAKNVDDAPAQYGVAAIIMQLMKLELYNKHKMCVIPRVYKEQVETTAKHERGHTCRFIQPRLYQSHYLKEYEVTRRAPYQTAFSKPELLEGETRRKDNVYETNHERRGKAVIFVEQEYPRRLFAHEDTAALIVPLQGLGFEVERYICDETTMIRMLRTVAKEDHNDADCFLCVAFQVFLDVDELLHTFGSEKCPSLAGKPKIFIFQSRVPSPLPCVPPEPDYLIMQSSWFPHHYGFEEVLATALNERINKNGKEDFVHVCVEVMRAWLEQIIEVGMSDLLQYNYVATSSTKDLYLLPAQGSSSKTVTETHQKEKARYLHTDPKTSKKEQPVASYPTEDVYQPRQEAESEDSVKSQKQKKARGGKKCSCM